MRHGSLFSGIGGFDLAAEWIGWENKFHCEWNEFCKNILKQYWPNATQYGDIDETDFTIWRGRIDVLSGGFPCQPYSTAGLRKGKEDERHKWPQFFRAIREIQPRWVVGENVRGIINWNGGMVFDEVQADLESAGYEVLPFLLPACAVNAPHRRDRIWFIAYSASFRRNRDVSAWERVQRTEQTRGEAGAGTSKIGVITDTNGSGLQGWENQEEGKYPINGNTWRFFPTQPPVCCGNDGVSNRVDRIKALGNAIVPQVALQIFKAIEQYEKLNK